jgi:hypothetical protein
MSLVARLLSIWVCGRGRNRYLRWHLRLVLEQPEANLHKKKNVEKLFFLNRLGDFIKGRGSITSLTKIAASVGSQRVFSFRDKLERQMDSKNSKASRRLPLFEDCRMQKQVWESRTARNAQHHLIHCDRRCIQCQSSEPPDCSRPQHVGIAKFV